jgi:hypothetical protein
MCMENNNLMKSKTKILVWLCSFMLDLINRTFIMGNSNPNLIRYKIEQMH